MNAKQRSALNLLAGSPGGLTGDVLRGLGYSPQTLRVLVSFGFISATVERMTVPAGMTGRRYRITPAGRKARSADKPS
jgi:hypothetical protein